MIVNQTRNDEARLWKVSFRETEKRRYKLGGEIGSCAGESAKG